jgi:hypothetical protein
MLLAGVIFVDFLIRLFGESAAPTWHLITILVSAPALAIALGKLGRKKLRT